MGAHHQAYHNSQFVEFLWLLNEILQKHTRIHLHTVNAITIVWLHLRNAKLQRPALLRGLGKRVAAQLLTLVTTVPRPLLGIHRGHFYFHFWQQFKWEESMGQGEHLQFTPQGNQITEWSYRNIKIFSFPLPRTAVSKCLLHWESLKIATLASSSHFILAEQRLLFEFWGLLFFFNLTCIRIENN